MDGQQQQMKKAAEKIGEALSGEGLKDLSDLGDMSVPDSLKQMADDARKKAATAKDALGLSDQMIEGIYGQAYRLYNTGKYKDASQLFKLLIMLDAKEPKYLLGMAACFHMMKEYENALGVYMVCGVADPESPLPHYHSSDCYIQMKDKISAIVALEIAVTRAGEKPEFQMLKDRAKLTIENLKKELTPKNL